MLACDDEEWGLSRMEPSGLGRSLIYAILKMRRRGDLEREG